MSQLDRVERKLDTILENLGLVVKIDNNLLNKPNKYGFKEISTKVGGRDIPHYNEHLDLWIEKGDHIQRDLGKTLPRKVIVNYQLTKEQLTPLFYDNNNYYFTSNNLEVKHYNNDFPPAAMIVDFAKNQDKGNIDNHLIACARNSSFSKDAKYQDYLKAVSESCIRFANREYKRLSSRDALQLK